MIPIRIKFDVAQAVKKIKAVTKRLTVATMKELDDTADRIKRAMQVPGRKVKYPIKWDSDKQRRFVMAKLREEDNLPYKRTQDYVNGWVVDKLTDGYQVRNLVGQRAVFIAGSPTGKLDGAQHVLPTGQSHIHEGRWKLFYPTMTKIVAGLPKRIKERFLIEGKYD
jgi:hypothetical protein